MESDSRRGRKRQELQWLVLKITCNDTIHRMKKKNFVEQSKWLTQTRVKEAHRGFDTNNG